ncbi:uncharacterized protein [Clytia hemisphaerica]
MNLKQTLKIKPTFVFIILTYLYHQSNAQGPGDSGGSTGPGGAGGSGPGGSFGPPGPAEPPAQCSGAIPMTLDECEVLGDLKDAALNASQTTTDPFRDPSIPDCDASIDYKLCSSDTNVSVIWNEPYSNFLAPVLLLTMIQPYCCQCNKDNRPHSKHYDNLTQYFKPLSEDHNGRELVFPVLGPTNGDTNDTLYGYYFTPMYPLEGAIFLTKKAESDDTLSALLDGIFGLFPLLIICLLLAFLAGFVGWLMESRSNTEEFRKPFIHGIFDGFWWSFVSMTTVG